MSGPGYQQLMRRRATAPYFSVSGSGVWGSAPSFFSAPSFLLRPMPRLAPWPRRYAGRPSLSESHDNPDQTPTGSARAWPGVLVIDSAGLGIPVVIQQHIDDGNNNNNNHSNYSIYLLEGRVY